MSTSCPPAPRSLAHMRKILANTDHLHEHADTLTRVGHGLHQALGRARPTMAGGLSGAGHPAAESGLGTFYTKLESALLHLGAVHLALGQTLHESATGYAATDEHSGTVIHRGGSA